MKNQFKAGIIYLLVGSVFIGLSFVFPDVSIFLGLAGMCIGPGLLMLYKHSYWKKRTNEYSEKIENDKIMYNDERLEMIRGKVARVSILVSWALQSFIIVTLTLLGQFKVLPYDYVKPIVIGVALYWMFSAIIMQLIYKGLSKRY